MPEQATVEQALRILGANKAFRDSDIGFAHACIALLRVGQRLSTTQRERAYRLLDRYRDELSYAGVPYDAIQIPDGSAAAPHEIVKPEPIHATPATRTQLYVDVKGRLVAKTPYALREVVQNIGGLRYQGHGTGLYAGPASPALAEACLEAFSPTGVDYDEAVGALLEKAHSIRAAGSLRSREDLPAVPVSKTDAWTHQRQAFWFAKDMTAVMLDMAMGTGKSKVVTDLLVNNDARNALIVCPERVVGVWPKQFLIHAGREVHVIDPRKENRNGQWKLLPIAERVALYDQALNECPCGLPHFLLSNYAASVHEPFKSWSKRQHWDYVIYDESHRIKSGGGAWSLWAHKLVKQSDRRIGGTGTLQPQIPLDVFGQFRALDPGIFGTSERSMHKKYGRFGGFNDHEYLGMRPEMEAELADKIALITYRVTDDVLDLPEKLPPTKVTCQLSPSTMRVYREVEQEMYAELRVNMGEGMGFEDAITADNVLVKILRCMQITGGSVKLDSGELVEIDNAKEGLLEDELIDIDSHEPVVVFARFTHDLKVIQRTAEKLGRQYRELSGNRDDALTRDATLVPDVQVAGVQIQAGGVGIDFTRSAFGLYYSVGHSLADFQQSQARLRRPGQTRAVRFRYLVAEGTIDEEVYRALKRNESITARIGEMIMRRQRGAA